MPYPNEHACSLVGSLRGKKVRRKNNAGEIDGKSVDYIYAIGANGKSELASVRFPRRAGWDDDEATEAARRWCSEHDGKFEPMAIKNNYEFYISDTNAYVVQFDHENRILFGVPIMRPGKFNGYEYDVNFFNSMIENFHLLQHEYGFEPAVKPHHAYNSDGEPIPIDAREIFGYVINIYMLDNVLCCDIQITNDDVITHITTGTLRYLSTEIAPNYIVDDAQIGPALIGLAFVDDPAVKKLPWRLIINRCDLNSLSGGNIMGFLTTLKNLLLGVDETTLEQADEIITNAENAAETEEAEVEEAEEAAEAEATEAEAEAEDDVEAETEAEDETENELMQLKNEIQQLKNEKRMNEINRLVDDLTSAGVVKPHLKDAVVNHMQKIYDDEQLRNEFIEVLRENSDMPNTNRLSVNFDGEIVVDDELPPEKIAELAKRVMGD